MRSGVLIGVGVLVALVGVVWTLQGLDVMTGSSMSGTTFWAIAGPIVVVVGIALIAVGWRRRTGT